jgi:hypothetical protein
MKTQKIILYAGGLLVLYLAVHRYYSYVAKAPSKDYGPDIIN